jgi:hypothetical protein
MPTSAERKAAEEILKPPDAKNLDAVRERRMEIKDILNGNLLSAEARKAYEELYAETGEILERAVKAAKS